MTPELPPALDVLAVGAHPDDVEIAVGGTLARLVQQGHRVGICDLTNGEPTPGSPGPETRLAEAVEAARILGVQMRETLTLPNRCLFDSFSARIALARVIRLWRPKIVMGIAGKTPMASPDHWQAMHITESLAMKLDAIRAYKTQFPPSKERVFRLVESQNRFYGATAGFEAGEMLFSATTMGIRNLVETLCPTDPV